MNKRLSNRGKHGKKGETQSFILSLLFQDKAMPFKDIRLKTLKKIPSGDTTSEDSGIVKQHLRKLKRLKLIGYDKESKTYSLPKDFQSFSYLKRAEDKLGFFTNSGLDLINSYPIEEIVKLTDYLRTKDNLNFMVRISGKSEKVKAEKLMIKLIQELFSILDEILLLYTNYKNFLKLKKNSTAISRVKNFSEAGIKLNLNKLQHIADYYYRKEGLLPPWLRRTFIITFRGIGLILEKRGLAQFEGGFSNLTLLKDFEF
ncbi:MAG: hypothetical protein V1678_02890 [Candidatus Aenigmatarchaeota archaeon]